MSGHGRHWARVRVSISDLNKIYAPPPFPKIYKNGKSMFWLNKRLYMISMVIACFGLIKFFEKVIS